MLDIEIIKIENFEIGFERLKKAKLELAGNMELFEYLHARFALQSLAIDQVSPSTFYALENRLEFQRVFYKSLSETCNLDLFDLPGIIYFRLNGLLRGLVPPIIEIYEQIAAEDNYALQDGVHRFLLAEELGLPQKCIVINNKTANKEYLPYAFTNSWDRVKILKKPPLIKKHFRRELNYSFMRPLADIFDKSLIDKWADYGR